jgi:hypothetical protein
VSANLFPKPVSARVVFFSEKEEMTLDCKINGKKKNCSQRHALDEAVVPNMIDKKTSKCDC